MNEVSDAKYVSKEELEAMFTESGKLKLPLDRGELTS